MAKTEAQRAAAKARRLKRQGRSEEAARVIDESYRVPRDDVPLDDQTDYSFKTGYILARKECLKLLVAIELFVEVKPGRREIRSADLGNIVEARSHLQKALKHMSNNRDVVRRD